RLNDGPGLATVGSLEKLCIQVVTEHDSPTVIFVNELKLGDAFVPRQKFQSQTCYLNRLYGSAELPRQPTVVSVIGNIGRISVIGTVRHKLGVNRSIETVRGEKAWQTGRRGAAM